MSNIEFIKIDPKADIDSMTAKYEEVTNTTLYPAQDAKILINIFAYYINLLKCQFNDAANLNLIEKSRYPILDFLGKRVKCERLENEDDESYIQRILLAPEGYSTAGPELAYIYHTLSADSSILDCKVDVPDEDIKINSLAILNKNTTTDDFDISIDNDWETVTLTLNRNFAAGETISVKIPHPYKLNLYVLTEDDETLQTVLDKVSKYIKPFIPISDKVNILSATTQNFIVSGVVYVSKNAILENVKTDVNTSLNAYFDNLKTALNHKVDLYDIKNAVRSIDGVVDFDLTVPIQNLSAFKNVRYKGEIGELSFERVQ